MRRCAAVYESTTNSSSDGLPLMLVPLNIDFWVGPTRAARVYQQSSNVLQRQRTLAQKITATPFRCCILARATSPPVLQQRTRVQLFTRVFRISHFAFRGPNSCRRDWRWCHIVLLAPGSWLLPCSLPSSFKHRCVRVGVIRFLNLRRRDAIF